MLELVDHETSTTTTVDRTAELICEIRESYSRRCLKYTGESIDDAEMQSDRRSEQRVGISIPFYLRVTSENGTIPDSESSQELLAVTRDLTHRGIGFQCDSPITDRFYAAEFDGTSASPVRLLIEIRWRRRKSSHHFIAGGRIVGPIDE